eukprot:1959754-Alexandrium_andersonii.AAC.1
MQRLIAEELGDASLFPRKGGLTSKEVKLNSLLMMRWGGMQDMSGRARKHGLCSLPHVHPSLQDV